MSGDPFKKLHEEKTRRMQQRVAEAKRQALSSQTALYEKKTILQPTEGQVFSFKDEEIRGKRNQEAKVKNQEMLAK